MSTVRRMTTTLVGIITTCVLSAGAAAAQPEPLAPNGAPIPVTSSAAPPQSTPQAQVLLRQTARAEHMQRMFAQREAAAVAARRQAEVGPRSPAAAVSGARSQTDSGSRSQGSGDGTGVAVLGITALVGLALGAAGSTAARRLRARSGLAA